MEYRRTSRDGYVRRDSAMDRRRREMAEDYSRYHDDYDHREDERYLCRQDMREWSRMLENADGSHGAKFTHEQVMGMAKEHGIHFRRFTEDEFVMTVNMMYADYCEAVGASDIAVYIKMAKAFLEDPDARVDGGEKLAIYYECFVE